jgi:MFS transporter, ACS family, D-galactonate transporter
LVAPAAMGKVLGMVANNQGYELGFSATGVLLIVVGAAGFLLLDPQRSHERLQQSRSA